MRITVGEGDSYHLRNTFHMTQIIHKVQFENTLDEQRFMLPQGANVLKIGVQDDKVTLWYSFYKNNIEEKRDFRIFMTGEEGVYGDYLDTVQAGAYVLHVYEVTDCVTKGSF